MVGFGLAAGLLGALATARLLSGFLYGVQPADPAAILAASLVLAAAAALATLLPVRRATRVDPVIALAAE
jgi:ABC-type antimicrobial peptide transport system permease subunit